MTVKDFYNKINENYDDVINRLYSEDLLKRILLMFLNDNNTIILENSINEKNSKNAFIASHTLKGTALNLGFNKLASFASIITEELRNSDLIPDSVYSNFEKLKKEYQEIISIIKDIE